MYIPDLLFSLWCPSAADCSNSWHSKQTVCFNFCTYIPTLLYLHQTERWRACPRRWFASCMGTISSKNGVVGTTNLLLRSPPSALHVSSVYAFLLLFFMLFFVWYFLLFLYFFVLLVWFALYGGCVVANLYLDHIFTVSFHDETVNFILSLSSFHTQTLATTFAMWNMCRTCQFPGSSPSSAAWRTGRCVCKMCYNGFCVFVYVLFWFHFTCTKPLFCLGESWVCC